MLSALFAWLMLLWFKPAWINISLLLSLIRQKSLTFVQLAELAVTGAAAISAVFVLLVLLGLQLWYANKKQRRLLAIIQQLEQQETHNGSESHNKMGG